MLHDKKLLSALKLLLKSNSMTYLDLAQKLEISEVTVKRMLSSGALSVQRLMEICEILGVTLVDLGQLMEKEETPLQLSLQQETKMAAEPKLAALFYLILQKWTVAELIATYNYSELEIDRYLLSLDKLKLIDLMQGRRVKLRVSRNIRWSENGPLATVFEKVARTEFVQESFLTDTPHKVLFRTVELSASSLRQFQLILDRLMSDLNRMARADASLPKSQTTSIGFAAAFRPFVFKLFDRYRRT